MNADLANSNQTLARVAVVLLGCALGAAVPAAQLELQQSGTVTSLRFPTTVGPRIGDPIYVNARPLPLPIAGNFSPETAQAELIGLLSSVPAVTGRVPHYVRGTVGDGKESPVFLGTPAKNFADDGGLISYEYGTSNLPFSTARADGATGSTDKIRPYSASGKLFFNEGTSAFVCSASLIGKGLVLTAAHVIAKPGDGGTIEPYKPNQRVMVVLSDGTTVMGRTLGINRRIDSGMIQITDKPPANAKWPGAAEGKWPALELGKTTDLKKGQYVIALGHPGGPKANRPPPVRLGQFLSASPLGRSIRTDCTLVGGDSGGPLFDMSGKLIGIHSRIGLDIDTNIHVPIEAYKEEWAKLKASERVGEYPPVIFGVVFNERDDTSEVLEVKPETPADYIGITKGDRIVKFNGKKIERSNDVYELLYLLKPGAKVKVEFQRGEETMTVDVTLTPRPREPRK